jgi:hypothetical protein
LQKRSENGIRILTFIKAMTHRVGISLRQNLNGKNDTTIKTMKTEKNLPYSELTSVILGCCFEVMKELGPGFLEKIYKNALLIAMRQKGLAVEVERAYEVVFRGKIIGR